MINEHRLSEVESFEARFSSREKELRIARLNEQQAQDSLSIARQRTWIFALVGGLILANGGGGFLIYRRRKIAQEQLADQKLYFQKKILDSTVEAQENERQRIAKDLHDGPVQCTLLEMGMIPAIGEMLNKTLGQTGITFRFDHYALDGQRFAKNIEISLYRICQELVNNIMKHSGATEVDVQVYKTKSHLILHVEDNGKGMDSSQKEAGLGLNNIYSRASSVNEDVQYESGLVSGTVANIRVPI